MAHNDVGTQEVMRHALHDIMAKGNEVDYACCIYATAPLMLPEDLHRGFRALMEKPEAPYAYSCALKPQREKGLRWDAGQWYWGSERSFLNEIPLDADDVIKIVIPDHRVCDINTAEDLRRAEQLYSSL